MPTLKRFALGLLLCLALVLPTTAQTGPVAPSINPGPAFVPPAPASSGPAAQLAGKNLVIGGVSVQETPAHYQQYIKYLTVYPSKQSGPVFQGNDIAAIMKLEDPLRRQIFDAMMNNHADRFLFANLRAAQ